MPDVSVVVPTRNRSAMLAVTLRSVLDQRGVDLEVLVVDEASSDDTADVVAAFDDPRVRMIQHEQPQGLSSARNRGAAEASGQWLAFIDDDDVWAQDKLACQIYAAENAGSGWAYVGSVNISDSLQVVSGEPPADPETVVSSLARYNSIPGGGSNVIMRSDVFQRAGRFDYRLEACEDWEMWLRLRTLGTPGWVCRPLMGYRLHSASMSMDVDRIHRSIELIERWHGVGVDWGRIHRWFAESYLRMDRRAEALREFAHAAALGQLRGVLRDLALIARGRVARILPGSVALTHADRDSSWLHEARSWLDSLHHSLSVDGIMGGNHLPLDA